jgi:uncharacterized membrane protein
MDKISNEISNEESSAATATNSALGDRADDALLTLRGDTTNSKRSGWSRHPAVHSEHQLTTGQRAADALRNGMGSWPFVLGAIAFLGVWIAYNRNHGFDKYPFILLNLVLSCVAALQGAILLIAAKRQDQIASQLALHDYETNLEADQIIKQVHALTLEIHQMMRTQLGDPSDAYSESLQQNSTATRVSSNTYSTAPTNPTDLTEQHRERTLS